ncbi:SRPBCC family protein [Microbacterium gorillae]|uniref:SRPBCC family protein n=1 Tax=Microbacterium gorillae TaxID=1231063 RepID=UPI0005916234|nr:SRPBCC family protein [Microbacterium gorillae]
MWTREVIDHSAASPAEVYALFAAPERWWEWNAGVASVRMDGPFAAGTTAVMVFPDGTELPFHLAWVRENHGFGDVTEVPDAGVVVRVSHELEPEDDGTRITYRCDVDGPDEPAAEVGAGVTSDFAEVIASLARRAESAGG